MKLDKLYSLRNDFTIIGLTGRTGSGCTKIAELLQGDFQNLKNNGLRNPDLFSDQIFAQKYRICNSFLSYNKNWTPYEVINYRDLLLFFLVKCYGSDLVKVDKLLEEYYWEEDKSNEKSIIITVIGELRTLYHNHSKTIKEIYKLTKFSDDYNNKNLEKLNALFFKDFVVFAEGFFDILAKHGYIRRTKFMHHIACNIRKYGEPIGDTPDIKNIYTIAELINKLIKSCRQVNSNNKPTKIVIDSLRNSLEIMFFKERYSAFYLIATKDVLSNAEDRIIKRLKERNLKKKEIEKVANFLIELDKTEYKTDDFSKGNFASADVENCIQKSDYHIFNLKKEQIFKYLIQKKFIHDSEKSASDTFSQFLTRDEQLMKLIVLISQPGIITPSSAERCMQFAYTAKLNSGCISRSVGAAITDSNYYIRSIGWNDVAKGHTPCNLRTVSDYFNNNLDNHHYSPFEKGKPTDNASYKYKNNKVVNNFPDAIKDYYQNDPSKKVDLNGKNCSFCFKTIHNHYEGEANQVHIRSLHGEENAMLQLTKIGGQGVEGGNLFTTASPCELCAKKAYQLGIRKIYYIDPYPGISSDQILSGGKVETQPVMLPFSGAIGSAYHQLYEPFMAYKEELSMRLDLDPPNKLTIEFKNLVKKIKDTSLKNRIEKMEIKNDKELVSLLNLINNTETNK